MTYFVRSDDGPWDLMADLEHGARRDALALAVGHGKERGCRFNTHRPDHPVDMTFGVLLDTAGHWEDLTEDEIIERIGVNQDGYLRSNFLATSQWDFWWDA